MIWYIKEKDWCSEKVHGPYDTKNQAEETKSKLIKEKNGVKYIVFSRDDLL